MEVNHTKRMKWGELGAGLALNDFKQRMFLSVLELLKHECPPPARLLDVGCSFGGFLIHARNTGYSVCGVDIVPAAVDYVNGLGIQSKIISSLGRIANGGWTHFDAITCLDCNCYWPDQPSELRYAFDRLRSGGCLVLRVVDKSWMFSLGLLVSRMNPRMGNKVLATAVNDHRFSMPVSSLLKELRAAGFSILYASPKGALHSHNSGWPVKLSFLLGRLSRSLGGPFIAPGALVLARKG